MDANKIRNFIIIFLLGLNAALFALVTARGGESRLTGAQEAAVRKVFSDNGIVLAAPVPRDRSAKKKIQASEYSYSELINLFMDNFTNIKYDDLDNQILVSDNKELALFTEGAEGFLFDNPSGNRSISLTFENARGLCEEFIKSLPHGGFLLKFDRLHEYDGYYLLEYRSVYKKNIIWQSCLRFKVTERGIERVRGSLFTDFAYLEPVREVFSSGEALMALLHELKNIYGSRELTVTDIGLVYNEGGDSSPAAEPCYLIYIDERSEPFLVNAYTNLIVK